MIILNVNIVTYNLPIFIWYKKWMLCFKSYRRYFLFFVFDSKGKCEVCLLVTIFKIVDTFIGYYYSKFYREYGWRSSLKSYKCVRSDLYSMQWKLCYFMLDYLLANVKWVNASKCLSTQIRLELCYNELWKITKRVKFPERNKILSLYKKNCTLTLSIILL